MGNIADKAERFFINDKYNCAESSLFALCEEWGLTSDAIPMIATGFGGGVGKKGLICGALAGAVMATGLRCGTSDPGDTKKKALVLNRASQLVERFRETFGETDCRELIGCDLSTPEGVKKAKVENVRSGKCRHYVRRIVEMAVDICD